MQKQKEQETHKQGQHQEVVPQAVPVIDSKEIQKKLEKEIQLQKMKEKQKREEERKRKLEREARRCGCW